MHRLICTALFCVLSTPPAHAISFVWTCPICPCPPTPGCPCPNPPPPGCADLGPRFGFDTNADIEPGDTILNASIIVEIIQPGVSIYLLPPVTPQSLLPPSSTPMTYDQKVRTFVSSYSCYPNDQTPPGACPVSLNPQSVATPSHVNAIWSPTESLPSPGVYVLFRVALQQTAGLPGLTLMPTQQPVAQIMGNINFENSGMVPVNYVVYRLPDNACDCPGDMNNDGLRNGRDIRAFTLCVTGGNIGCTCADFDGNGSANPADVPAFVSTLLSGVPCQ